MGCMLDRKYVHMQYVERDVTTRFVWASRKLHKPGKILTREMKKTGRRATRRYAALGAGLVPDYPGLRGREKPKLYLTCKSREVSRN